MEINKSRQFETTFSEEQIIAALHDLKDDFYVRWNFKKSKLTIRKKAILLAIGRVPIKVSIKGRLNLEENRTIINLSVETAMNVKEVFVFDIVTFLILFYIGMNMGAIIITLAAITLFSFIFSYFISTFSSAGEEIFFETLGVLTRTLELKELDL